MPSSCVGLMRKAAEAGSKDKGLDIREAAAKLAGVCESNQVPEVCTGGLFSVSVWASQVHSQNSSCRFGPAQHLGVFVAPDYSGHVVGLPGGMLDCISSMYVTSMPAAEGHTPVGSH